MPIDGLLVRSCLILAPWSVQRSPVGPELFQGFDHGMDVVETRLFQQQFHIGKVVGEQEPPAVADKVENVPEHVAVAIDEVVLLEAVQHDGDAAVEHFGEAGVAKTGQRLERRRVDCPADVDVDRGGVPRRRGDAGDAHQGLADDGRRRRVARRRSGRLWSRR